MTGDMPGWTNNGRRHLHSADVVRDITSPMRDAVASAAPGTRSRLHDQLWRSDALNGPPPPVPAYVLDGLVRAGDLVALVSAAKAGKSLLVLDRVLAAVAGGRRVLYADAENGFRDIHHRVHALGHGAADLSRLHYLSYPQLALDEPAEAAELLRFVDELAEAGARPDLVVLDTASRFLASDENDSAGWLAMYRLALLPIKARGIAVLRLDHFGKDTTRGARGSSAKAGDVDAVFELTADAPVGTAGQRVTLDCPMQRSGTYEHHQVLVRGDVAGVLGHRKPGDQVGATVVADPGDVASTIIRALDEVGAPLSTGRDRAVELVGDRFPDASVQTWKKAVRERKERTGAPRLAGELAGTFAANGWSMPTTPNGPGQ